MSSLSSLRPPPPFLHYYYSFRDWNLEGTRAAGAQSFAIIFGAAKRSLSLSLVLMVSMGYGVVRPSLGRDVHKIMGMALIYFISSAVRECSLRPPPAPVLPSPAQRASVSKV